MTQPTVRPGCEPFAFGEGPIGVLMVHGFTGSPASMRPIGEWLASEGISVEGVRLPGHGTDVADLRSRRWTEWVDEAANGLDALRGRCRTVVALGQSMGASVVLSLVTQRPHEVDGIALTNPYVFDRRLLAVPVGRRLLRNVRGIANDVAKPGQDERGYDVMPVAAIAEMASMMKLVRASLPQIRQPVVVFRSATDHVVPRERRAGARVDRFGAPGAGPVPELVPRGNARPRRAPLVRERVLSFARELDAAKG